MKRPLDLPAQQFQEAADRVTKFSTEYLENLDSMPAYPATSGARQAELFDKPLPETGIGDRVFDDFFVIAANVRPGTPRFFGYVLGSGEPIAATADLAASVLNQNVTAWRSGPAAVTIEHAVVRWLAEAIGCSGFRGSLTGGGSPANLMALAMAREAKLPANEHGAQPGMVYASTEIHMSIGKAVALLGLGRDNLRLIPIDENFRMVPAELERAIELDRRAGKKIIAVVGSAGTVNTGAIDQLADIARIAREHNAWFHVDGAYGALAAMAAPEKFAGLNECDSLSLDPHKWLYQPLDCGCLLYRDSAAAQRAFSHSGDYARVLSQDPVEGFAFFEESLELSRRFRALKVWTSLRYHGIAAFRESIRQDLELAQYLAKRIDTEPKLERLAPVELSAVCFRHRGGDDAFNAAVLKRVIDRRRVYISNATIRGRFALRACIVNHRTTEKDIDAVIEEVLAAARSESTR